MIKPRHIGPVGPPTALGVPVLLEAVVRLLPLTHPRHETPTEVQVGQALVLGRARPVPASAGAARRHAAHRTPLNGVPTPLPVGGRV